MWIWDTWYVVAVHFARPVLVSPAKRARVGGKNSLVQPSSSTDSINAQMAAEELEWRRYRSTFERYGMLRPCDLGAADRVLSKLVKSKESLTVALRNSSSSLLSVCTHDAALRVAFPTFQCG